MKLEQIKFKAATMLAMTGLNLGVASAQRSWPFQPIQDLTNVTFDTTTPIPGAEPGSLSEADFHKANFAKYSEALYGAGSKYDHAGFSPRFSRNGRFILFSRHYYGDSAVPGCEASMRSLIVEDQSTGAQQNVFSVDARNGHLNAAWCSDDGNIIVFSGFVPGKTPYLGPSSSQVYLLKVRENELREISTCGGETLEIGNCFLGQAPCLSADGRFATFMSQTPETLMGAIWVYDAVCDSLTCVSTNIKGGPSNGHSCDPSISADGSRIAFTSESSDLVKRDTNNRPDIFVTEWRQGAIHTIRASEASFGFERFGECRFSMIAGGGNHVIFICNGDLDERVPSQQDRLYVHDIEANTTQLVHLDELYLDNKLRLQYPSISDDGTRIYAGASGRVITNENVKVQQIVRSETALFGKFISDQPLFPIDGSVALPVLHFQQKAYIHDVRLGSAMGRSAEVMSSDTTIALTKETRTLFETNSEDESLWWHGGISGDGQEVVYDRISNVVPPDTELDITDAEIGPQDLRKGKIDDLLWQQSFRNWQEQQNEAISKQKLEIQLPHPGLEIRRRKVGSSFLADFNSEITQANAVWFIERTPDTPKPKLLREYKSRWLGVEFIWYPHYSGFERAFKLICAGLESKGSSVPHSLTIVEQDPVSPLYPPSYRLTIDAISLRVATVELANRTGATRKDLENVDSICAAIRGAIPKDTYNESPGDEMMRPKPKLDLELYKLLIFLGDRTTWTHEYTLSLANNSHPLIRQMGTWGLICFGDRLELEKSLMGTTKELSIESLGFDALRGLILLAGDSGTEMNLRTEALTKLKDSRALVLHLPYASLSSLVSLVQNQSEQRELRALAAEVLSRFGPDAREILPTIEEMYKNEADKAQQAILAAIIETVDPTSNRLDEIYGSDIPPLGPFCVENKLRADGLPWTYRPRPEFTRVVEILDSSKGFGERHKRLLFSAFYSWCAAPHDEVGILEYYSVASNLERYLLAHLTRHDPLENQMVDFLQFGNLAGGGRHHVDRPFSLLPPLRKPFTIWHATHYGYYPIPSSASTKLSGVLNTRLVGDVSPWTQLNTLKEIESYSLSDGTESDWIQLSTVLGSLLQSPCTAVRERANSLIPAVIERLPPNQRAEMLSQLKK